MVPGLAGPSRAAHLRATHSIHLVRHLPSAHGSDGRITASGFATWSQRYDRAGLAAGAQASAELVELATRCTVLCSPLPRAVATARLALHSGPVRDPVEACLRPRPEPTVLPVLARAARPDVRVPLVRLYPWTWRAVTRLAWHCGWTPATESPVRARARAAIAADELAVRAADTELLVVGHNYFNTLIAAALQRHGWAGPRRPSSELGGLTTYQPPAQPVSRYASTLIAAHAGAPLLWETVSRL